MSSLADALLPTATSLLGELIFADERGGADNLFSNPMFAPGASSPAPSPEAARRVAPPSFTIGTSAIERLLHADALSSEARGDEPVVSSEDSEWSTSSDISVLDTSYPLLRSIPSSGELFSCAVCAEERTAGVVRCIRCEFDACVECTWAFFEAHEATRAPVCVQCLVELPLSAWPEAALVNHAEAMRVRETRVLIARERNLIAATRPHAAAYAVRDVFLLSIERARLDMNTLQNKYSMKFRTARGRSQISDEAAAEDQRASSLAYDVSIGGDIVTCETDGAGRVHAVAICGVEIPDRVVSTSMWGFARDILQRVLRDVFRFIAHVALNTPIDGPALISDEVFENHIAFVCVFVSLCRQYELDSSPKATFRSFMTSHILFMRPRPFVSGAIRYLMQVSKQVKRIVSQALFVENFVRCTPVELFQLTQPAEKAVAAAFVQGCVESSNLFVAYELAAPRAAYPALSGRFFTWVRAKILTVTKEALAADGESALMLDHRAMVVRRERVCECSAGTIDLDSLTCTSACGRALCTVCDTLHVCGGTSPAHRCDPDAVATVRLIRERTKPCPECGARVEREEGCNDMFCTFCGKSYNWETLQPNTANTNPNFYKWAEGVRAGATRPDDNEQIATVFSPVAIREYGLSTPNYLRELQRQIRSMRNSFASIMAPVFTVCIEIEENINAVVLQYLPPAARLVKYRIDAVLTGDDSVINRDVARFARATELIRRIVVAGNIARDRICELTLDSINNEGSFFAKTYLADVLETCCQLDTEINAAMRVFAPNHHPTAMESLTLFPRAVESLRVLNDRGMRAVRASNALAMQIKPLMRNIARLTRVR